MKRRFTPVRIQALECSVFHERKQGSHEIVDVIQFPPTYDGNRYAVVFMDYLTKWPEVYPTSDQTAETIAKLFVEKIVCRHGVPTKLL